MTTYKCPRCGNIVFYDGKGEAPEKCIQRVVKNGRRRSCGTRLKKQHEIKDEKVKAI
jgi:DNA-directed RNA polymerase subunit RPC12/RpoP